MNKLLAAVAFLLIAVPAQAGIANTKHNLSPTGTGVNKVTAGTDEICVFCHTPHAADTSAPVPLWNKKLPAGTGYTTYAQLQEHYHQYYIHRCRLLCRLLLDCCLLLPYRRIGGN